MNRFEVKEYRDGFGVFEGDEMLLPATDEEDAEKKRVLLERVFSPHHVPPHPYLGTPVPH